MNRLYKGIIIFFLFILGVFILRENYISYTKTSKTNIDYSESITASQTTFSDNKLKDDLGAQFLVKEETLHNELEEGEIQKEIERVRSFFYRYGAVLSGTEEIIVRKARECGGDYRLLIGIAGNESGLGRIPYKLYNPYGYLNGVQYSSWEESINTLSCEISRVHLAPCNNELRCVINRYAGNDDTDKELWIKNVTWFMNQV
ncbi:MAG: hypothetical protein Q9M91_05360 [Candidatus Dojkabacteria bacterium]|nr:hypothetical protein [Candidatus Dojkabacteria bacterium]MDQ7021231.1 hypothetical protein [Candidatus Dojkabacteria bacterium]